MTGFIISESDPGVRCDPGETVLILLYAIGILQTFLFNRRGHMTIKGLAQRPSFVTFQLWAWLRI